MFIFIKVTHMILIFIHPDWKSFYLVELEAYTVPTEKKIAHLAIFSRGVAAINIKKNKDLHKM